MRVKIGPYLKCWGPYQIADLLKKVGVSEDRCRSIGEWLSNTWVEPLCGWIYSKRKRTISVKIDKWDSWNADNTLAYIIVPVLKQLLETKHGSPYVDDSDVPPELASTVSPPALAHNVDGNHHERWRYVLKEMIWAFEQQINDWESELYAVDWRVRREDTDVFVKRQHDRMANGYRLFGKYYQALWD